MVGTEPGMLRLGRSPDSAPYSRETLGHFFSLSIPPFPHLKQRVELDDLSGLL